MALAEEIGFANCLVGERNIEGRCGQEYRSSHEKAREDAKHVLMHEVNPKEKYSA